MVKNLLLHTVFFLNLGHIIFVKKDFDIIVFQFLRVFKIQKKFYFRVCEKSVMALPEVRHGSRRSPLWLCEQSVMALGGIRHL